MALNEHFGQEKRDPIKLLALCHVVNYLKYKPPDFLDELTATTYYLFHPEEGEPHPSRSSLTARPPPLTPPPR